MKRLAIVVTHPIQYYTPLFKLLAERCQLKVFYTWGESSLCKYDPGFGRAIEWDIDLLSGYNYEWLKNVAKQPGSDRFSGIVNPHIITRIRSFNPDGLLVFGWAYNSHLKVIQHFHKKVPVYFRGDSTLLGKLNPIKSFLKSVFLKWLYRHIDIAFYVGANNKAYFKEYGLNEDQLKFTPHSIDNDRFAKNRAAEAQMIRMQLGINETDILFLFAGKFESNKSPEILLHSFLSLSASNSHLLFVGNGDLETSLKQVAKDKGNVHFMDFQNQSFMPVIYQACDVFCLPSTSETWGLAVNEAMACNRAIIVSDKVGCALDLILPNGNGYIFQSGNESDLTDKLRKICSRKKTHEMGKASAEIIKSWSFAATVDTIVKVFEDEKN